MIIKRVEKMRSELGIPLTSFCRQVGIATSTYYAWRAGNIKLSAATEQRITEWLERYGF